MAFCVHVDEHGNEMERVQLSSRSVRSNCSRSSSNGFSTVTESDTLKQLSSRGNPKSIISASSYTGTSTIRNCPSRFSMSSDSSSRDEQSSEFDDYQPTESNTFCDSQSRTYCGSQSRTYCGSQSRTYCDSQSRTYCDSQSWTESTADSALASDTGTYDVGESTGSASDIVPPLDLASGTQSGTYHKKLESVHLGEPEQNAAYESWLSAKMKHLSTKQAEKKKKQEEKDRQREERERLSKDIYDKWLQSKVQRAPPPRKKVVIEARPKEVAKPVKDVDPVEARRRLSAWEEKKRIADEKRQQKIRDEQRKKREYEEQRKKMSNAAWQNWIAGASKKPKPVPLNQGMATLRGTVSNIYINPNEWKSILEED